jgi:transposase
LFDEVEDGAGAPGAESFEDDDSLSTGESSGGGDRSKRRGKRKRLPDHLLRVRKIIDLPDAAKVCSQHQMELEKIGEEIVEKLEVEPAKAYVLQLVTPKTQSFASAGLLALIATQKYAALDLLQDYKGTGL